MYCPDCGTDVGEAKFCPECGADLGAYREAKAVGAGEEGANAAARQGGRAGGDAGAAPSGSLGPQPRDERSRGPSARLIWILVGVVAAVVAGVVLFSQFATEGVVSTGETGAGGGTPAATPAPVKPDLSGPYAALVKRANGLYDKGKALFDQSKIDEGAAYFAAAAKVYEAAWKKRSGDPAVGTDWAVALFYSGDMEGAVDRVTAVLEKEPEFQKGWLNKGIFLTHLGRMQSGEQAGVLYDEARQAFVRAVAIDPDSDAGKSADAFLSELPK